MSPRSLVWPLTILGMMFALLVMLLFGMAALPSSSRAQATIICDTTKYPDCQTETSESQTKTVLACTGDCQTQTAQRKTVTACDNPSASDPVYPICKTAEAATATRIALAKTQTAGVPLTQTAAALPTRTPTSTIPPPPTDLPTPTPTATATSQPTPNAAPTATAPLVLPGASRIVATATPTGLPLGAEVLDCPLGTPIRIAGETRPHIPLLLFFDTIVVGGGISNDVGAYDLLLIVGEVRGGLYQVLIVERSSGDRIRELFCRVPDYTPTPTYSLSHVSGAPWVQERPRSLTKDAGSPVRFSVAQ